VLVSSGLAWLSATRTQGDASRSQHPADDTAVDTELGGEDTEGCAALVAPDEITHLLGGQPLAVWRREVGAWWRLLTREGWLPQQPDQAFLKARRVREMLS